MLLSTRELAHYLNVTPKTVMRWVTDGRIPCYRVNQRLIRFDREQVEAALRADPEPEN